MGDIPSAFKKPQVAHSNRQLKFFRQDLKYGNLFGGDFPISPRKPDVPNGEMASFGLAPQSLMLLIPSHESLLTKNFPIQAWIE